MADHTPTPWHALDDNTSSGLELRGGSHHYPIAKMCSYWDGPGPREFEAKANYNLIVRAVNSHYALVEALKPFVDALDKSESLPSRHIEQHHFRQARKAYQAALASKEN